MESELLTAFLLAAAVGTVGTAGIKTLVNVAKGDYPWEDPLGFLKDITIDSVPVVGPLVETATEGGNWGVAAGSSVLGGLGLAAGTSAAVEASKAGAQAGAEVAKQAATTAGDVAVEVGEEVAKTGTDLIGTVGESVGTKVGEFVTTPADYAKVSRGLAETINRPAVEASKELSSTLSGLLGGEGASATAGAAGGAPAVAEGAASATAQATGMAAAQPVAQPPSLFENVVSQVKAFDDVALEVADSVPFGKDIYGVLSAPIRGPYQSAYKSVYSGAFDAASGGLPMPSMPATSIAPAAGGILDTARYAMSGEFGNQARQLAARAGMGAITDPQRPGRGAAVGAVGSLASSAAGYGSTLLGDLAQNTRPASDPLAPGAPPVAPQFGSQQALEQNALRAGMRQFASDTAFRTGVQGAGTLAQGPVTRALTPQQPMPTPTDPYGRAASMSSLPGRRRFV